MPPLPALQALAASGLTLTEVCRRGRVSPAYFRRLARHGAPYHTGLRLARVLGCSLAAFVRPLDQVSSGPTTGQREVPGQGRGAARCRRDGSPGRRAR